MGEAIGWMLDEDERQALLQRFPPRYAEVDARHVTLHGNPPPDQPLPGPATGEIVGEADDGAGCQCLVVRIGGTTDRWDGSTYHVTWSLDGARGRRAIESNLVIAMLGWTPVDPAPVTLTPGRF